MSDFIAVAVVDLKAGPVLDWAVAKAVDVSPGVVDGRVVKNATLSDGPRFWFSPSTDWAQGGALIDQGCGLFHCGAETGAGTFWTCSFGTYPELRSQTGSTALEAACKAIVSFKCGDAVTVPRELVEVAE